MLIRRVLRKSLVAAAALGAVSAFAGPIDDLREFVKNIKTGRAEFTQTVTSPDGKKIKKSDGSFDFSRPGRFRFLYDKPYAQTIVGDGIRVWIYDPDLNQVSSRKMGDALGATPAALLVSNDIDQTFRLAEQPSTDGFQWVVAAPRQDGGTIHLLKVAFKDHALAQLEIDDSFGQRSVLVFQSLQPNIVEPADTFQFTPPKGADIAEQ